jgi:hypothetical protein
MRLKLVQMASALALMACVGAGCGTDLSESDEYTAAEPAAPEEDLEQVQEGLTTCSSPSPTLSKAKNPWWKSQYSGSDTYYYARTHNNNTGDLLYDSHCNGSTTLAYPNRGSSAQGRAYTDCGPTSVAMMRHALTCGESNHNGGYIRQQINKIYGRNQYNCWGTNGTELSAVLNKTNGTDGIWIDGTKKYGARNHWGDGYTVDNLITDMSNGWVAVVGGNYRWSQKGPCGWNSRGGHSIFVGNWNPSTQRFTVFDPDGHNNPGSNNATDCGSDRTGHAVMYWTRTALYKFSNGFYTDVVGSSTMSTKISAVIANGKNIPVGGATCGNGVVESGEACDDGSKNGTEASCCGADCRLEAAGSDCLDTTPGDCYAAACTGTSKTCNQQYGYETVGTVCTDTSPTDCYYARCTGSSGTCSQTAVNNCSAGSTQCATALENTSLTLSCPAGVINAITFASYGTPNTATCGSFAAGTCNASSSLSAVQNSCLNRASCTVTANNTAFGDPCAGTAKKLGVQYTCGTTMPVPTGLSPSSGTLANPLTLQWNPVTGADSYAVQIQYFDGTEWDIERSGDKLTTNSLTFGAAHPGAQYSWSVAACNGDICSDWSAGATFTAGGNYLSNLNWTYMTNGWGPAEKDRANGEWNSGDGQILSINGVQYQKGLGVHAPSEVRYVLNGAYSWFQAEIGVDDYSTVAGSVVFQAYLDGVKVYDSGTMNYTQFAKRVDLNVSGKNELKLVVTDAGDGGTSDHANWADAKLLPIGAAAWHEPTTTNGYYGTSVCNAGNGLRLDGTVIGVDYAGGGGTTVDGQLVTGCARVYFSKIFNVSQIAVTAASTANACGSACSGSYCNTSEYYRLYWYDRVNLKYTFLLNQNIGDTLEPYYHNVNLSTDVVLVCRGGGGEVRDDVLVDHVSILGK